MDENKRKQIEAKLSELFTQNREPEQKTVSSVTSTPVIVKVIRKRKGKTNRYIT